jgi:hypothetical protein
MFVMIKPYYVYAIRREMNSCLLSGSDAGLLEFVGMNPRSLDRPDPDLPVCRRYGLNDLMDGTDRPVCSGAYDAGGTSPSRRFRSIDTPYTKSLLSFKGSST